MSPDILIRLCNAVINFELSQVVTDAGIILWLMTISYVLWFKKK